MYTIGVFDEEDPDQNKESYAGSPMSQAPKPFSNELTEVVSICEHIARDIRNQYVVGYVSTNAVHARRISFHSPLGSGSWQGQT